MDANVLIDLWEADRTVIRLISECVGQVHVPLPVLREEVDQIDEAECADLGIIPVEPEHEDGWAAKKEGAKRSSVVTPTQGEAIDAGRKIARREGSELFIHGRDGKIREKDSHGRDPNPPKG